MIIFSIMMIIRIISSIVIVVIITWVVIIIAIVEINPAATNALRMEVAVARNADHGMEQICGGFPPSGIHLSGIICRMAHGWEVAVFEMAKSESSCESLGDSRNDAQPYITHCVDDAVACSPAMA